jgi:hypothetical protein
VPIRLVKIYSLNSTNRHLYSLPSLTSGPRLVRKAAPPAVSSGELRSILSARTAKRLDITGRGGKGDRVLKCKRERSGTETQSMGLYEKVR